MMKLINKLHKKNPKYKIAITRMRVKIKIKNKLKGYNTLLTWIEQ